MNRELEMPPSDRKKEVIKFSVSPEQLEDARVMAEKEGLTEAEFHRICWILGLNAYYDGANKRLVNKRMSSKLSKEA